MTVYASQPPLYASNFKPFNPRPWPNELRLRVLWRGRPDDLQGALCLGAGGGGAPTGPITATEGTPPPTRPRPRFPLQSGILCRGVVGRWALNVRGGAVFQPEPSGAFEAHQGCCGF